MSMSQREDSNPRPADYKSAALPTELRWQKKHYVSFIRYIWEIICVEIGQKKFFFFISACLYTKYIF
jgi:hypothetical protein